ncbi:MAG: U32 family peptidase C-terminal domain-containing protein, partial [Ruthenibacterium sp.]
SCTQRGKFSLGDTLEALTPAGECITFTPEFIWDANSELVQATPHAKMEFRVPCETELPQYSILRHKL